MPYFAYFSNLNPQKLGPDAVSRSRRFPILRTRAGVLRGYELVFDVPGVPLLEPVFCNIRATSAATTTTITTTAAAAASDNVVHGVLHWLSAADIRRLPVSEGVLWTGDKRANSSTTDAPNSRGQTGPFSNLRAPPILVPSLPGSPPLSPWLSRVITVAVHTVDPVSGRNDIVHARTFEFPHVVPFWAPVAPSSRYPSLGISRASHWQLCRTPMERAIRTWVGVTPHPLDRPNTTEQFGSPALEIFSPYTQIRARVGMHRL